MPVQFCGPCGMLLDESPGGKLTCEQCGATPQNSSSNYTQTTTSTPSQFPSRLRTKLESKTQTVTHKTLGQGPTLEVQCPKCPAKEVSYSQVQLRSADEGSTIFYECLGCGHRWQEDN